MASASKASAWRSWDTAPAAPLRWNSHHGSGRLRAPWHPCRGAFRFREMMMPTPPSAEAASDAAGWPAGAVSVPGFRGALLRESAQRRRYGEASGIIQALPAAVAVPRDARDVAALVRWAGEQAMALIPRGAGTGMPGGNVGHGVAVDLMTRFRPAPRIDPERRLARVGPGT